jgi:hypothetical protein
MADLSLITEFSGVTITSDQTTGTTNPNATLAVASVTQGQRDKLENVTPYTVGGNTNVRVKNGTMIYNITTQSFQVFLKGTWNDVLMDINDVVSFSGLAGTITLTAAAGNPSIVLKNTANTASTTIQAAGTNTAITYILPAIAAPVVGQKLAVSAVAAGVITLGWVN